MYLTCAEVGRELSISRNAVYAAYYRGSLRPAAYAGERPLFLPSEVERYKRVSQRGKHDSE